MNDNALVAAVQWIEGVALGPLATAAATIAVAVIGFMMLNGRLPIRRGVVTIAGCFILFGAPQIAAGILGFPSFTGRSAAPSPITQRPPPAPIPQPSAPMPYDPYAGAAVPQR